MRPREMPMPKWKKDAEEFMAAVHHNEGSGYHTTSIPKPVIDRVGKGERMETIKHAIKGNRVRVKRA